MSASANSDSESGGEEGCNVDNEGIASPESVSRSSSPALQSPTSPQSPSPHSPSSLQSPESPYDPEVVNGSPATSPPHSPEAVNESPSSSPPHSPEAVNESPASSPPHSPEQVNESPASSPPHSPEAVNESPASSPPHSPEGVNESPASSPPPSPASSVQGRSSPASSVQGRSSPASSVQGRSSPASSVPGRSSPVSSVQGRTSPQSPVSVNGKELEDETQASDAEGSVHVESDTENKSDDEESSVNDHMRKSGSPSSPHMSPLQTEEKESAGSDKEEEIKKLDSSKPDSDAEDHGDSESDADSDESEVGGLIADIFGESDDDEEFEGFNEDDIGSGKTSKESTKVKKEKKKRAKIMSDSEDEKDEEQEKEESEEAQGIIEDVPAPPDEEAEVQVEDLPKKKKKVESDDSDEDGDRKMREDFVSDFDLMMQKKKEESSKRRRRRDVDLISDSDDLIADIISQMRQAAEEDKILNKQKKTATKKLKILPMVMSQLKKQDLKTAFLDQGVLNVIAEWLTPLPDRSLPHLNIREGMMKQLGDLPPFDQSLLKSSGIGRALMYLYKHPKETKENREKAGRLITEWARPIFNVTTNYHSLTKEEREQRDYDHVPQKKRKLKDHEVEEEEAARDRKDIEKEMDGDNTSIRPGDKGWIGRARVPMPSTKDYVNRPKWNKEMEFGRGPSKKPLTRIEKHMRSLQDKKRLNKQQRAITISIEGRKMAI